MLKRTYLYLLVPPILLLSIVPIPTRTDSVILSNDSILKASWSIAYCNSQTGQPIYCNATISDGGNGYTTVDSNSSASTFLIQFRAPYTNMVLHEALYYHLRVAQTTFSNLTIRFSQVASNTYYSTDIATLDNQSSAVLEGTMNVERLRDAFANVQGLPIRLEIDARPSIIKLMIDFEVKARDEIAFGSILFSNFLALSGTLFLASVYYRSVGTSSPSLFQWLFRMLLTLALVVISLSLGSFVFQQWPPLSESFVWVFSFGVGLGGVVQWLFFVHRREMA